MMGIIILTTAAFISGLIIVFLTDKIKIKGTSKEEEILKRLPGVNCGSCEYATCEKMVEAIMEDKYAYTKCKVLRGVKKEEIEKFLKIKK